MTEEITIRRIFKEQIRKELLDELKLYQVGWAHNGEIIATKSSSQWSGFLILIPDEKYRELFR